MLFGALKKHGPGLRTLEKQQSAAHSSSRSKLSFLICPTIGCIEGIKQLKSAIGGYIKKSTLYHIFQFIMRFMKKSLKKFD
jgi:hypothetical protein